MEKINPLLTIEDCLESSEKESGKRYKQYMNPGLARLLKILKINRNFVRAADCSIWDSEGTEYTDFLAGYGSVNFGHNNKEILESLEPVLNGSRPNILQTAMNPLASGLAHNLSQICPGHPEKTFFCNSGTEAVESALKMARKATGKKKILYTEGSFHGKTFGSLSVTGREKYQLPFEPLVPECYALPYGELKALEDALRPEDIAAFIVEPIQGEGGIILPPEGYLSDARALCRKHGCLFIADEIQTGFGRTGRNFACEYEDIDPDIITLAKSLGGGVMPIGAAIARTRVWKDAYGDIAGRDAILHSSTFGGNSLACLSGIKAVEILCRDNLAEKAEEKGSYLLKKLKNIQKKYPRRIKEVRGKGLFAGVEFEEMKNSGMKALQQEYQAALIAGILFNKFHIITAYTLNNPNVIRLEPPLTITTEQIDKLIGALDAICSGSLLKNALSLI